MSESSKPALGTIGWADLSVANANEVRDFYQAVVGWRSQDVPMGEYSDYAMLPPMGDTAVSGICHARGVNADLPPCWLVYITVKNLDESLSEVRKRGGKTRGEIRGAGGQGRFCVIEDPAGAVACLYEMPR